VSAQSRITAAAPGSERGVARGWSLPFPQPAIAATSSTAIPRAVLIT
jgi:hypothetical protein